MESLVDLHHSVLMDMDEMSLYLIHRHLSKIGHGQLLEIYEQSGKDNGYYKWLYCYTKSKKPKQITELGAAAGISTLLMAVASPRSKIISVDCDPNAWRWMDKEYPNVTKVLGDDLDLGIYPETVGLHETDFWFFDSLHTKAQLNAELELYKPFFKKGAILTFDDIHINSGMNEVWDNLPYEKLDISNRLHYTGWGLARI